MEKDSELGEGHNHTKFRELDTRIGRWMSVDPAAQLYYSWSPYNLSMNNPVTNSDPSGATTVIPYSYTPYEHSSGDGAASVGKFAANTAGAMVNGVVGTINYAGDVLASNSPAEKVANDLVIQPVSSSYTYLTSTSLSEKSSDLYNLATSASTYENLLAAVIFKKVVLPKKISGGNGGTSSLEIAIKQTPIGDFSHVKIGVDGSWYDFTKDYAIPDPSDPDGMVIPKTGSWKSTSSPSNDYNTYRTAITVQEATSLTNAIQNATPSNFSYWWNNCSTNATKMLNQNTSVKTTHGGIIRTTYAIPKNLEGSLQSASKFESTPIF